VDDIFVSTAEEESIAPARWRLIVDAAPRSGAANMALDQALAEACAAGTSLPTVRFYRWQPPAVSLGRHQSYADLDEAAALGRGYEIVRRPTGGRAILHTDEFTYSVAAPQEEPRVQGGVMDSYLRISQALLAGLRRLGVQADKAPASVRVGPDVSAACFEVPSAYEITTGTRKLMGSAQSRRARYVLQHGSLPLVGAITRLVDVLALPAADAATLRAELAARACTLAQALGVEDASEEVSFDRVSAAMRGGFEETLALTFELGAPTAAEVRRTAELIREQYANDAWTRER
jgi:lipoate-protein ligase A